MYLGVILCVTRVQSNGLEVQAAVKVHCSHDVPLKSCEISLTEHKKVTQEDTYCRVGVIPLGP